MKICLVNSLFDTAIKGGAAIYTRELAEALGQDHEVTFIATTQYAGWRSLRSSTEDLEAMKLYRFYPANVYYSQYAREKPFWMRSLWNAVNVWNPHSYAIVRGILQRERPDVVHTHTLRALSPSVVSAIDSVGIPHVHSLHDYEFMSLWGNLIRNGKIVEKPGMLDLPFIGVNRLITRKVRAFVGPTGLIVDQHKEYGLFPNAESHVLPWGRRMADKPVAAKPVHGGGVLFVGDISRNKGIHVLLEAWSLLKETGLTLHIVGQGPLTDDVKSLAATDRRITYHGHVSEEEKLGDLYRAADLLVIPSIWYENLPLVSIEAFAYGTPVVASDIGGLPDAVEDGYNGLLFRPGDADDLARTLRRALADPELLKTLGENARKSLGKYSMDSHVARLLEIYRAAMQP